MHPIQLLLLVAALCRSTDGHSVYWEDRARELQLDDVLRPVLPREVLLGREIHLAGNDNCSRDLSSYRRAILRRDDWAVKMLDSSSKMPSGLMQGNLIELGMFDECIDVMEKKIRGKHCTYSLDPGYSDENTLPFNPMLSICLPDSCTKDDVNQLVRETISASDELKGLDVKVGTISCAIIEPGTISRGLVVFLLVSACVYVAFLCFCTYCDVRLSRGDTKWIEPGLQQTLVNFSMLRSVKAIFNFEHRQDDLSVIHGIRVLSNMGVIALHVCVFQLLGLNSNIFIVQKWYSQLGVMVPLVCLYCVDTFFALSGFLTAYGFFKKMQQGKQPNILLYYLHRYIRLSLPMLVYLFVGLTIMPLVGFGPRHNFITDLLTKGCQSKWWSYFFYLQNYAEKDNMCLLHFWSLAVDMQLFWISPFFLYPLYKNRKIGFLILTSFFLASLVSVATTVWMNNYSAIYIKQDVSIMRLRKCIIDLYISTSTRASPWFLGAAFGYEVAQRNIQPNKRLLCLGWILAIGAFIFSIWGIKSFTNPDYEYNAIWEVVFATLSKPMWAFGICWIIYASVHDYGGFLSTVLSSKIFLPLSRLAYSIYVSHVTLPVIKLATARTPNYFHELFLLFTFLDFMPTSIVMGFCFCILFEMPMFALEDLIFRKRSRLLSEQKRK